MPALRSATEEGHPLDDWLVFEVLGVVLGGAVGGLHRPAPATGGAARGRGLGRRTRLIFALGGGILMGIAARMARGCTSGQALTGGALLSVGSWAFMFAVFGGGYALAYFVRRQWR